jgi:hypothetical protein
MKMAFVKQGWLSLLATGISVWCLAQTSVRQPLDNVYWYAGIEIGSKGVKMSILETAKTNKKTGNYKVIKDTSVNTDFISFTDASYSNTLKGLYGLYAVAHQDYAIPGEKIFTVFSSGVKVVAERESKTNWITNLADSFRKMVNEPKREMPAVDVTEEARLSHLGIVPASRRYNTFLIDIGSGNTKGGYFPNGNTKDLKLFQLSWGTRSVNNEVEKRLEDDKTLQNYFKQLYRVLAGNANDEIIYAVNASGAYNMSDNIAFSGGVSWAVANLILPEMAESPVVPVTYDDVLKFSEKLFNNYDALSSEAIVNNITDPSVDKNAVAAEIKRVNKVFDQRSLLAGTGLLLKIMRQFEGIYEKKQFFLVKNGQVGWISAYVDQYTSGK